MSETVHNVTELPKPSARTRKIVKWSAVGILAAGTLLLINDKLGGKQKKDVAETDTDN